MSASLRSIRARARVARGWSTGFYIAGIAALGCGLLVGAIVAAATGTGAGFAIAAVIAAAGVATGGLGLWESRRFRRRARRLEAAISEHRLHALAHRRGGVLRAADVARDLQVMRSEAEELLDHLVDEVRVSMRVTDEGEIEYEFREVERSARPRLRIAVREDASAEESTGSETERDKDANT